MRNTIWAKALLALITLVSYTPAARAQFITQPSIDPAYARTKVRFERVNVSETSTAVYDKNGKIMGRFFATPIEVPVDDRTITASIAPSGQRIMSEVLTRGMIIKNTPKGPMVRVLVSDYDGYQADRSSQLGGFTNLNTPTGDMYVPLSEFQRAKYRVIGLREGAGTRPNANYSRFLNAVGEPSGNFVRVDNDIENERFSTPAPTVNPRDFAMYPPTCDCARGSCPVTSTFGRRSAPVRGASSDHRAIDIGGGQGTKLVAPDRIAITENGWSTGYGWRTVMRSLTYTNPQLYYAFNHQVSKPPLSVGQVIEAGEQVGIMGSTGRVSGPHLHLEVYKGGLSKTDRIDQLPLIRMNMQRVSKTNTEIISYSCTNLRARIRGGPSLPSGGTRSRARR